MGEGGQTNLTIHPGWVGDLLLYVKGRKGLSCLVRGCEEVDVRGRGLGTMFVN